MATVLSTPPPTTTIPATKTPSCLTTASCRRAEHDPRSSASNAKANPRDVQGSGGFSVELAHPD